MYILNIELYKNFQAIHLKEFKLKTLIKDYWKKTNNAIKIRLKTPKLFNGYSGDIPLSMHISGGFGLISIFTFFTYIIGTIIGFEYFLSFIKIPLFFISLLLSFLSFPKPL